MWLRKTQQAFTRVACYFTTGGLQGIEARKKFAEQKTITALGYLRRGDWQQLRQQFIPICRYLVTEQMLEKGCKYLQMVFGRLEHVGPPTCAPGWFMTTTTVPVQFKRVRLMAVLRMTPSGKLFNLTFAPLLSSLWQSPSYANTKAARETNIRLGKGLFKVDGTLTLPAEPGRFPCVVLIGGSGPIDRDSTVGALKPFKDIALGLASNDIAVCRFDKVTFTYKLWYLLFRRTHEKMTLMKEYDHALDAIRRIGQHPEIHSDQVFLLGHSLGGLVAGQLAATKDSVAGAILMATPTESIYRSAIHQFQYLASLEEPSDASQEMLSEVHQLENQAAVADSPTLSLSTPATQLPFGIGPAYWLECRAFNPIHTTRNLEKPILVLQGGRDYQVNLDDYENLYANLKDKANVEFHVYDSLNHCFVAGEDLPSPAEYECPGNVHFEVIQHMEQWVKKMA